MTETMNGTYAPEKSEFAVAPRTSDPPYLVGMKMDYQRDVATRAALLQQVIAIENRWQIGSRKCQHCGRDVRKK